MMVGKNTMQTKIQISKIILDATILIFECSNYQTIYRKVRELVKISGVKNTLVFLNTLSESYKGSNGRVEIIYECIDMINELMDRGVYTYQSIDHIDQFEFVSNAAKVSVTIASTRPFFEKIIIKLENSQPISKRIEEYKKSS